jgi:CHAT domain-containing protein/tetratricopeptide (TPR) repeat protein
MYRSICIVVTLTAVSGCGGHSAQATLDEAEVLDRQVETLERDGRSRDAISPAQRSLMLRERALGPRHPAVAASLTRLAALHRAQAAYGEADALLQRALEIGEKAPAQTDLARTLSELGLLYLDRAELASAEPVLARALDLREKVLGPAHVEVATALNAVAELRRAQGAFDKAAPLYARALEIREKALGPAHPDVAATLNGIAGLHRDQGEYDKAEPLYRRALEIREKALGPAHPVLVRTLDDHGQLQRMLGAFDKAEALHARALEIGENALGPMHPAVARSLSDLGNVYWYRGAFAKAETLHARALDIREKVLGPTHGDVARSLNNLALVVQDLGQLGRAESLSRRALDIIEKTLGPMHPNVATVLSNLSAVYYNQGAYDHCEQLLIRALDIIEKALGPTHGDIAQVLQNLAIIQQIRGDFANAESTLLRAQSIAEKALGPEHQEVAQILNNLAWVYRNQRMHGKAEPLLVRAVRINEKTIGPAHPLTAGALENLAAVYRDQGAFDRAAPLVRRALDIYEKAVGPMHPETANGLHSVARLHWVQGEHEEVVPLVSRATEIREAQLRVELPRLPEPRKRALMTLVQDETETVISLHAHAAPRSPRALELALTTTLRRKGRILDSLVDNETALRGHLTTALREQLDQLDRARSELVAQLYTPHDATDPAAIASIRARIDDLEGRLSAASAVFRAQSEPVTVAKVQAAVPPGAALVELVRYHRYDPKEVPARREERYIAYIVTRERLQWVALGEAAPIDAQVDATLAAVDDRVAAATARAALRRLDARVLAPIRAHLAGVSHLILAPDGKLNLVPFEALVDERMRHAVDRYLINYVTTGRDVLRFAAPPPRSPSVLVAGPDYGPLPSPPSKVAFVPLSSALAEAADLEDYFRAPPLTGDKATKSALKALTGPAILHIATHGFYARSGGQKPMPAAGNPSREMFTGPNSPLPPPRPDDPADGLDRAGLAMAGANQGADGIVTAREIAGFDWWGTQLVVLSACETGVGAVPSGDGVYGMRRALVLAGTASQVVSLWAVDDASTRILMRDYYAELARGTGRAEALRAAKRRMMHEPRYAHPHHWAAFIPAGDWRPLDKNMIPARVDP